MGIENRKQERITVNEMILTKDTPLIKDTIRNISGNGCFIQTNEKFNIGDKYKMLFNLHNNKPITINGEIVWEYTPKNREDIKDLHGYGITFLEIKQNEIQKVIDAIIYFKVDTIEKKRG